MTSSEQQPPRPQVWETPFFRGAHHVAVDSYPDISARLDTALYQTETLDQREELATFLRSIHPPIRSERWEADRLLGEGGFGKVGLWVKNDAQGRRTDEVAIKHQDLFWPQLYTEPDAMVRAGWHAEAVIHALLNKSHSENLVHLRAYYWVPVPGYQHDVANSLSDAEKAMLQVGHSRLLMEYAPHGSLDTLKRRYRAWNRYLPEAFLWHVFDSLVCVLEQLDRPEGTQLLRAELPWQPGTVVTHFDLKPGNIVLGYAKPMGLDPSRLGGTQDPRLDYPVVKLMDFGLSTVTGPWDAQNPIKSWHQGTEHFRPPEQLHYGIDWQNPPNSRPQPPAASRFRDLLTAEEHDPTPGFQFLTASNIWAVGKTMYDLATLSRSASYSRDHIWTFNESQYERWGHDSIPNFHIFPFQLATDTHPATRNPYSPELMELVRSCLKPSIRERIGLAELRGRTRRGLAAIEAVVLADDYDEASLPTNSVKGRKLYFRANEINQMPMSADPEFFRIRQQEYEKLMTERYADPDWEPLHPPGRRFDRLRRRAARNVRTFPNRDWQIRDGRIVF